MIIPIRFGLSNQQTEIISGVIYSHKIHSCNNLHLHLFCAARPAIDTARKWSIVSPLLLTMTLSILSLLTQAASRLAFPAVCHLCGGSLDLLESALCTSCAKNLLILEGNVCRTCSRPLPPFTPNGNKCGPCRNTKIFVKSVTAVVPFDHIHRSLLHAVKFKKKRWLLDLYAPFIKRKLTSADLNEADVIIPVPIDGIRRRVREFNQAKDFAAIIASTLAKPVLTGSLKRRIGFRPQSTLKQKERLRNIRDQFFVKGAQKFRGKSVLLVDDILTTGATLNECASVLLRSGAREVRGFVLARAITH